MAQGEDDLRLLQDCLGDKPGAWEAFVARFTPYLAEACRRWLARCRRPAGPSQEQEVDDLLQEVFLVLLEDDRRALRSYQGRASLGAYLGAVVAHRVLKAGGLPASRPLDPEAFLKEDIAAISGGTPGDERLPRLREALARLPPRDRLALTLQNDGASLVEIGQTLGISPNAAAQALSRARDRLRRAIIRK